jgi:tetratricopeptide (TPR) repeat protein
MVVCSVPENVPPLKLDVLERLDSLIEKSLVYRQDMSGSSETDASWDKEPRFGMLETIREYALEQLEASGERASVERAHADYFLALSEQAEPHLVGVDQGTWLDLLEQDYSNLQAALEWLHGHAEFDLALRMAAALWSFWDQRGYYVEGRRWLERLLDWASEIGQSTGERSLLNRRAWVKVLIGASGLAWDQQDLERAKVLAEEALTLIRADGNLHWTADVMADLGLVALDQGMFDEAVAYLSECLELAQQIGDEARFAAAQLTLSLVRLAQGDLEQAQALAEEALVLDERYGNKKDQVLCLHMLAGVSVFRGDHAHARLLTREALLIVREIGYVLGLAVGLVVLACSAALEGRGERAATLLGAEEIQLERTEGRLPAALQRMVDQVVQPTRSALGEEAWVKAYALGRASSFEEALAIATVADTGGVMK